MRTYTIKTICSRCGGSEERALSAEELTALKDLKEETPAVQVIINGVVDSEFAHLCSKCPSVVQNYADRIAKRPTKKAEPEPATPVDPNALRWDSDNEEWVRGAGEVGVDCQTYAHTMGKSGLTIVIPALEGVADPADAGALIAAYEEKKAAESDAPAAADAPAPEPVGDGTGGEGEQATLSLGGQADGSGNGDQAAGASDR